MRARFIIIVLMQVLLLVGIIGYRQYWVSTGEKVLLRTVPVDPRDIFRGDYVNLNYEITNLDLDRLSTKEKIRPNETIFIILKKDSDNTFSASALSRSLPPSLPFIQGRARYETTGARWNARGRDDSGNMHSLNPPWFSGIQAGERALFCLDTRGNVLQLFKLQEKNEPKCSLGTPLTLTVEDFSETRFRQLNVEYGIESYFLEEGKGLEIESARRTRDLMVEVSLRKDGKGIISSLIMAGKTLR